jgi:hypothetical protein
VHLVGFIIRIATIIKKIHATASKGRGHFVWNMGGQSGIGTGFASVTSRSSANKIPKIRNVHIAINSQRRYVKLATDYTVK